MKIQINHRTAPIIKIALAIVHDLLDLVHNVILIKCIFGSGNPGGSGFWVKGSTVHGLLREQRGLVYEQQGAEVDGS